MSITTKVTKQSTRYCGFCESGAHSKCPVGILNGDGITVVVCACPCAYGYRCLDCGERGYDTVISPETWTCLDAEACAIRRETKRREALGALGEFLDAREDRETPRVREKAPRRPRAGTSGQCLHCGEPTKGGLFAPGHDSQFLSFAAKLIQDPESARTLEETLAAWESWGVSEALRAKLAKRVS